jgi:hypothetical protein
LTAIVGYGISEKAFKKGCRIASSPFLLSAASNVIMLMELLLWHYVIQALLVVEQEARVSNGSMKLPSKT